MSSLPPVPPTAPSVPAPAAAAAPLPGAGTLINVNGIEFDTSKSDAVIVSGCDVNARKNLAGDTLIKVRHLAAKTNLPSKLAKGLQVTTCKPSDLKDMNNFFNFVSQWETAIILIETHHNTYFMKSPCTLCAKSISAITKETS